MLTTFDFYHWDLWTLYHKVTFDGELKKIYINPEVTSLDVEIDLYSSWKEWARTYDNLKYLPAFRTTGGDPLPGGRRVGQYFFLTNGWKLVPPEDSSLADIEIVGNLFSDDGGDVLDISGFDNFRLIRQVVSQFTEIAQPTVSVTVTGSGLTPEESSQLNTLTFLNNIQTSSLNLLLSTASIHTTALNSIVNTTNITTSSIMDVLVSQSIMTNELLQQSASLAEQNVTLQTQLTLLTQQSASLSTIQDNTEQLLSTGGTLTPEQATMMLEMYRLLGLDPTRPLIVNTNSRVAGVEIVQSITNDNGEVTVTRV